jgi:hypothetical protein
MNAERKQVLTYLAVALCLSLVWSFAIYLGDTWHFVFAQVFVKTVKGILSDILAFVLILAFFTKIVAPKLR